MIFFKSPWKSLPDYSLRIQKKIKKNKKTTQCDSSNQLQNTLGIVMMTWIWPVAPLGAIPRHPRQLGRECHVISTFFFVVFFFSPCEPMTLGSSIQTELISLTIAVTQLFVWVPGCPVQNSLSISRCGGQGSRVYAASPCNETPAFPHQWRVSHWGSTTSHPESSSALL